MTYRVRLSRTFERHFRRIDPKARDRIAAGLRALAEDPLTKRPGADIKPLHGKLRPALRLRVGPWRVVFQVEGKDVRIIDVFQRSQGYDE